jgi:hypothetical protein
MLAALFRSDSTAALAIAAKAAPAPQKSPALSAEDALNAFFMPPGNHLELR